MIPGGAESVMVWRAPQIYLPAKQVKITKKKTVKKWKQPFKVTDNGPKGIQWMTFYSHPGTQCSSNRINTKRSTDTL